VAADRDDLLGAEVPDGEHREKATAPSPNTATVLTGPASAATAPNQPEPAPSADHMVSSSGLQTADRRPDDRADAVGATMELTGDSNA